MSQICCEIEPTRAMAETSSCRRQFTTVPDSFGADFPPGQGCGKFETMPSETLYDEDFYAWTQQQAALLRRLPPAGNELDLEHIAEEIEDLGRSDLRAARSLCQHIIEHFLKLEFSGLDEPADHWRDEIVEWRVQLEQILTRSIEAKLDLPSQYRGALRLVRRLERDVPGFMSRLPTGVPVHPRTDSQQRRRRVVPGAWDRSTFGGVASPETMNTGRKT